METEHLARSQGNVREIVRDATPTPDSADALL